MKITAVKKITHFEQPSRVDSFHYRMFHGICRRQSDSGLPISTVEDLAVGPLELIINDYRLNPIIQPGLSLIIVKSIAEVLAHKFDALIRDTVIAGVATIEYDEGSTKHWEDPRYMDKGGTPESILRRAAAKEKKIWTGPALMELVPHDGELLAERHEGDSFERTVYFDRVRDEGKIIGTKSAFEDFGVSWSDGVHSFRQDVYDFLAPHFHPDYFEIQPIEI